MCGLYGVLDHTGLSRGQQEKFAELSVFNLFRGVDSAGFLRVDKADAEMVATVFKTTETAPSITMKGRMKNLEGEKVGLPKLLMGHNRAATSGSITIDNAHPFTFGHIIGAHNGTIPDLVPKDSKEDTVDSAILFKMISEKGLQETIKELGPRGSYALTWVDTNTWTIHFIRNNDRPLYLIKLGSMLAWSSERWPLLSIRENNTKADPVMLTPDTHVVFDLSTGLKTLQEEVAPNKQTPFSSVFSQEESSWEKDLKEKDKANNTPKQESTPKSAPTTFPTSVPSFLSKPSDPDKKKNEDALRSKNISLCLPVPKDARITGLFYNKKLHTPEQFLLDVSKSGGCWWTGKELGLFDNMYYHMDNGEVAFLSEEAVLGSGTFFIDHLGSALEPVRKAYELGHRPANRKSSSGDKK